jgi:hypothetical protein
MKKQLIHIGLITLILLGFLSCNEPIPTELLPDDNVIDDELKVELLSPRPDQFVYDNGYDSTGIIQTVPSRASIISVNDIKNTIGNFTLESTFYAAAFFDKSLAIRNNSGTVIGYRTRLIGRAMFNGDTAQIAPYILRYKENGMVKDTLAGTLHLLKLNSRRGRQGNGDHVTFRLKPIIGQAIQFDILTPPEVTGSVKTSGNPGQPNFGLDLTWNSADAPLEIIIGGALKNRDGTFPIYSLKPKDDGHLRIPGNLLRNIPFDQFKSLVITFIRRYRTDIGNNSINDNFVTAHNIHNIYLPVP